MALTIDTLLPTPYGWTSVAELTPESILIDELGYPCRIKSLSEPYQASTFAITAGWGKKRSPEDGVIHVSENQQFHGFQFRKWEALSVGPAKTSLEGTKVMPDNWPVWKVSDHHNSKQYAETFSADQMPGNIRNIRRKNGQTHLNFIIPITFSLQLPHSYLKVDPYVLGVLLNYSDGKTVKIPQKRYPYYRDQFARAGYMLSEPEGYQKAINPNKYWYYTIPGLELLLQDIGFRKNRIPPEYLRGSTEQRMALIQGLLDQWNPYFSETNRSKLHVAFTTKNAAYSEQILELVRSLGFPAFVSKKWDNVHQIKWHPVVNPYRMPDLRSQYGIMTMRTGQNLERFVWKIYSCDSSGTRLVRDIEVDTPYGLYSVSELFLPVRSD